MPHPAFVLVRQHPLRGTSFAKKAVLKVKHDEFIMYLYTYCHFLIIIVDKEEENNEISVRTREGKDLGKMTLDKFKLIMDESISKKSLVESKS